MKTVTTAAAAVAADVLLCNEGYNKKAVVAKTEEGRGRLFDC